MRNLGPFVVFGLLAIGCGRTGEVASSADTHGGIDVTGAPSKGPDDAPVILVEFADFECPYCAMAAPTVDQLAANYRTGLRVVFKEFPFYFHTHAYRAGEAAFAANAQGHFWPYHDLLFAHQQALERADLENYAAQVGLDLARFRAALDARTYAPAVDADVAQGTALGVDSTPTFFVNGRKVVGNVPYATLSAVIDEELRRAGQMSPERG